jgi:uncharacterized protein YodC (DUF2158 family)
MDIFVGSVVRLASGGPKMTVAAMSGSVVTCRWFTDKGEQATGTFDTSVFDKDYEFARSVQIDHLPDMPG